MPYERIATDLSPAALAELDEDIALREANSAEMLQEQAQASAFAQKCAREWAVQERMDKTEHLTTEVLEVLITPGAGALSTWKTKSNFPIGAVANAVIGTGAKALSVWSPDNRGLRVLGRVGKTMLHCQLSITTRNLIEGE